MHTNKNQRKRKVTKSCPFQMGSRVRICSLFDHHDYQQGRTYFVADIDDDGDEDEAMKKAAKDKKAKAKK